MDNDNDFMNELTEIHKKAVLNKMQNKVKEQFNDMFEYEDDIHDEEPVQRTVKIKTDSKRKYTTSIPIRSQESFNEWIESTYYETIYRNDGTTYEVRVTVLKPGPNPFENMKPAYAFSTNF